MPSSNATTTADVTPKHIPNGNASVATPIADKVTESLHSSVDSLGKTAAVAESKLKKAVNASGETILTTKENVEKQWETSSVKRFAQENPVATAGIVFTAGMLVSSLLRRK